VGGFPLAVAPQQHYEEAEVELNRGATILFYTDGIVESQNASNRCFGMKRLMDALTRCDGSPAEAILSVRSALRVFAAGAPQGDDQTMLALRVE
jgi:sigma-B regulation protein RsbU (phosphoserine phosphatase)